ncbi:MAG: hypothetical protein ACREJB_09105 [Planctomycetaceae bacterium]
MIASEIEELERHPEWRRVLTAYQAHADAVRKARPEFDGWLERLDRIDGVKAERLSRVHGRLIALGFLKFQLAGQNAGVRYQLSPSGREALDA